MFASQVDVLDEKKSWKTRCKLHDGKMWTRLAMSTNVGVGNQQSVWGNANWDQYTNTGISENGQEWLPLKKWQALAKTFPKNQFLWSDDATSFGDSQIQNLQLEGDTFKLKCGSGGAAGTSLKAACANSAVGFTTFDRDNDIWSSNCAKDNVGKLGGNWYTNCHQTSMWHTNGNIYSFSTHINKACSGVKVWFVEN